MLDAEGKAKLRVRAELPGTAIIYISLDGTAETKVHAAMSVTNIHVAEEEIDFRNIPEGSSSEVHTVSVNCQCLTGGISCFITGSDASAFSIVDKLLNATIDGTLYIVFTPEETRNIVPFWR